METKNAKDAMTKVAFRSPSGGDLEYLAANLRYADERELRAATGMEPLPALRDSAEYSPDAVVATVDGAPAAILGTVPLGGPLHGVWMLGTDKISEHWVATLRLSRPLIRRMFLTTGALLLINHTHHANEEHHRWLRWVGAEFFPATPYGVRGEDFFPFEIRRETYSV